MCYNINSSQGEIIGGYYMLTSKTAQEISEQAKKKLEKREARKTERIQSIIATPLSKIEIRWVEKSIKAAAKSGKRICWIWIYSPEKLSVMRCYLELRRYAITAYLRSQGYTAKLSGWYNILIEW